jgi:hypothetical protein
MATDVYIKISFEHKDYYTLRNFCKHFVDNKKLKFVGTFEDLKKIADGTEKTE